MPYKDPAKKAEYDAKYHALYYAEHKAEIAEYCAKWKAEHKAEISKYEAKRYAECIEHTAWRSMIARCTNPRHPAFRYYGALGVCVADRWLAFENFLQDMGPRPGPKHSLSRTADIGNYEPGNVVWGDKSHQAEQKRLKKQLQILSSNSSSSNMCTTQA